MDLTAIVAVAIGIAIPALLILNAISAPKERRKRLARQSATASATIIDFKTTHSESGGQPVVKFRMRINFGDGPEDAEVELQFAVHALDAHRLQIGAVFPVRFDPRQRADFSVDFGGVTGVELSAFHG